MRTALIVGYLDACDGMSSDPEIRLALSILMLIALIGCVLLALWGADGDE